MPLEQATLDSIADEDIDFSTDGGGADDLGAAVVDTQTPVAPPSPAGSPADAGTVPDAGAAPSNTPAAGDPGAAPVTPAQQEAWYQAIGREHGLNLGADETAAQQNLGILIGRARQMAMRQAELEQLAEYGRQFQEMQRQQQIAPQPPQTPAAPAEPQLPWQQVKLSPLAQHWVDPLTRSLREGAPQHVRDEYLTWASSQRTLLETLQERPNEVLGPIIERAITPYMERIQQLEQAQAMAPIQDQARQFAAANASWMTAPDPLTGQYVYTPAGKRFLHYAQEAGRFSNDPQWVQDYGMKMLQRDLSQVAMQQLEQQLIQLGHQPVTRLQQQAGVPAPQPVPALAPAPAAPLANRAAALAPGAGQVPAAGGAVNGHARQRPTPGNRVKDFAEVLMEKHGLRDEDIDFTR